MRKLIIWFAVLTAVALVFTYDPREFNYLEDAKIGRTRSDIRVLSDGVEAYQAKHGRYPEHFYTLLEEGLTCEFRDPWGNEYRYDPEGKRNGSKKADVWTVTPDGKVIGNWSEVKK